MMCLSARHHDRPRPRYGRSLVVAIALIATLGSVAHGQQPSSEQMARAQYLFDEGIRLFNMGRFQDACPRFEASLALVAGIGTRGKLAECYEKIGRTASAWRLYLEVARLARTTGDELRRRVASERARVLKERLARITIMPGPSATVPGFEVRSNSRVVDPRTFGGEEIVDPGTYIIVASAPEHHSWSSTVRIDEGEKAVIEVQALVPLSATARPEPRPTPPRLIAAYGLISGGMAMALGGGAFFGLRAKSRYEEAKDMGHCSGQPLQCDDIGRDLVDSANRNANIANVIVGTGLAAAATGAILWMTVERQPRAAGAQSLAVSPSLWPDGMGVVLSRPF